MLHYLVKISTLQFLEIIHSFNLIYCSFANDISLEIGKFSLEIFNCRIHVIKSDEIGCPLK